MSTANKSQVRPAELALPRNGFTLIEMLVAVIISGILVSVLLQFIQSQAQFARFQTAREETQQNARSAVELISSELRSVGMSGIAMGGASNATSISVNVPRVWGVVCGTSGTDLTLLFPDDAATVGTLNTAPLGGVAFRVGTAWNFLALADNPNVDVATSTATCNGALGLLATAPVVPATTRETSRVRQYGPSGVAVPGGITAGSEAYIYDGVTYSTGLVDGVRWILRNNQPFAGPVPVGGLSFRYYNNAGTEITNFAGLDAATSVQIQVRTESRARFNQQPQNTEATTVVHLRNR